MFNYEYAWAAWAVPSYRLLPQNVRKLIIRSVRESKDQIQIENYDTTWPSQELRVAFEEIPSEILAVAARVVYFFGHWGNRKCFQKNGGYWKFANYCDQVLKDRLGMNSYAGNGMHLEVHQGLFRACVATKNMWTWEELDIATQTNKERIENHFIQPKGKYTKKDWGMFEAAAVGILEHLYKHRQPTSPTIKSYFEVVAEANEV